MERILDIAVSTWQPEGIHRVEAMDLPRIDGVTYVISWQMPGESPRVPESLAERPDVEVHLFYGKGLAANRNNSLRHCKGRYVLFADDDLTFHTDGIRELMRTFDAHPDYDMILVRHEGDGKYYPGKPCVLGRRMPKGLSVSSIDLSVRLDRLGDIRFDERFGLGAPVWQSGEDEIFVHNLRFAGLRCIYCPITVCSHDHPSTGNRAMTPGVAAATGRVIRVEYPATWIPRIVLKAWRDRRKGGRFFPALYHQFRGAVCNGDK